MIATLFVYGSRFAAGGSERTDLTEARLVAADALRRAMAGSYQSGNTVFYQSQTPSRDDLAISLISTLDANGHPGWDSEKQKPLFRGYLVFYRDTSNDTLKTFRIEIPETSVAIPLKEAEIRSHIGTSTERTLASGVDVFQLISPVDGSSQNGWSNPLMLRLVQRTKRDTPVTMDIPFKLATL